MFYLYKKTHLTTGLQYLGYTKNNPHQYKGSGTYWLRHLKQHGENVSTEILEECTDKAQVKNRGQHYSELWDVVASTDWANLKAEEADGGDMRGSQQWVDGRRKPEFRKKQADGARGNVNVRGRKWWVNKETNHKIRSVECPGNGYVAGFMERTAEIRAQVSRKLRGRVMPEEQRQKLSAAARGRVSNNKGTVWVVNTDGVRRRVNPDNIPDGFERV